MSLQRLTALSLYRNLLRTATYIPDAKEKQETVQRIKTEFNDNKNIEDQEKIEDFIKNGESRLRFLRTRAYKSPYQRRTKKKVHVVLQGDTAVEIDSLPNGKTMAYFKDRNQIDPDDLKRHHQLLRRQHFLDRPPGY